MTASESIRRTIPRGAQVTSWSAADGWPLRSFAWPVEDARPRGSILFLTGRGDLFEKYLELFHHWHGQGWTITSFDWRGQGGSGRCSDHPTCGHIDSFDRFGEDLEAFAADWVAATPGPHVVMGHSMGGQILLRVLVDGRVRPDAAVLIAPMLGIRTMFGSWLAEKMARLVGGIGNSARPAWRGKDTPRATETRQELLTHDRDRYSDELFWQQSDPALLSGPPSWQWVMEAFRVTRELRQDPGLKTMDVPVLTLISQVDKLVNPRDVIATTARLPDARLVRFGKESAHEILREVDRVRNRAIGEIELFLAARAQRR
ncbi:alpha/beta fold hydrolase [Stakelama tenebrarum]|uniref:Alpha/beta hydrolase n=1 Tax=Stakelama tenebrarum TaxID=2711215 RepID=A0A6G6Y354_9SPHN|nr:alpha/beta hydrolase [Sphingosinithalassobacter tenebrarum]QIG79148.1 alpha/beta hydrolase [Sphingosinithalassobacter tenebrarum]